MKKKNKNETNSLIDVIFKYALVSIITLFLLYFLTFVMFRPFNAKITQDRPIIKYLCEMQVKCDAGIGPYSCSFKGENRELERWKRYNGCNESTEGYYSEVHYERVYSYINVESCNCGGLM